MPRSLAWQVAKSLRINNFDASARIAFATQIAFNRFFTVRNIAATIAAATFVRAADFQSIPFLQHTSAMTHSPHFGFRAVQT